MKAQAGQIQRLPQVWAGACWAGVGPAEWRRWRPARCSPQLQRRRGRPPRRGAGSAGAGGGGGGGRASKNNKKMQYGGHQPSPQAHPHPSAVSVSMFPEPALHLFSAAPFWHPHCVGSLKGDGGRASTPIGLKLGREAATGPRDPALPCKRGRTRRKEFGELCPRRCPSSSSLPGVAVMGVHRGSVIRRRLPGRTGPGSSGRAGPPMHLASASLPAVLKTRRKRRRAAQRPQRMA